MGVDTKTQEELETDFSMPCHRSMKYDVILPSRHKKTNYAPELFHGAGGVIRSTETVATDNQASVAAIRLGNG